MSLLVNPFKDPDNWHCPGCRVPAGFHFGQFGIWVACGEIKGFWRDRINVSKITDLMDEYNLCYESNPVRANKIIAKLDVIGITVYDIAKYLSNNEK